MVKYLQGHGFQSGPPCLLHEYIYSEISGDEQVCALSHALNRELAGLLTEAEYIWGET